MEMLPIHRVIGITLTFICTAFFTTLSAQQVTGVWQGKIDRKKVELKIIQKGDSLTGTSYYYESPSHYRRYSIKGYFDPNDNSVVWWDDKIIEDKGNNNSRLPLLSAADFNCPGGGKMFLDGDASSREDTDEKKGPVNLTKVTWPSFSDEWDYVIENYTVGANDPYVIDSIGMLAFVPIPDEPMTVTLKDERPEPEPQKDMVLITPSPVKIPEPVKDETIEEKYQTRKKVFKLEIPVEGEFIELQFYDNAQVDGDSISLFLNDKFVFHHIRLTDQAYTIRIPTSELGNENELVMVAENLGSIPPNTSYMVAKVGSKRYEAQLASTQFSSAMIRLRR